MPKPNANMTVAEMKSYIRTHKVKVKLGLKRAELIEGLKKAGHWEEVSKQKKTVSTSKPSPTKWDPLNSPQAPMDEWFPCMVFSDTGRNPKPYEGKYIKQKYRSRGNPRKILTSNVVLIRSSSYPKGIIAAGDMGHLDYGNKRVSQFRFSKETITVTYDSLADGDHQFSGLGSILTMNESHRLLKNQPANVKAYYNRPEFSKEMGEGDFAYDIVRKFKFVNKKVPDTKDGFGGYGNKMKTPRTKIRIMMEMDMKVI